MGYKIIKKRLQNGGLVIMDGGTGTEMQRRGVGMDPAAWCGPATLQNAKILEDIHLEYISSGANIITANTYASSHLMLEPAGFGDRWEEINTAAVSVAFRAREKSGRDDILIAGSLSHMCPMVPGTGQPDPNHRPSKSKMSSAFLDLAFLLKDQGCDFLLLEMLYDPEAIPLIIEAAVQTGLPVWAGFSVRRDAEKKIIGFATQPNMLFQDIVQGLDEYDIAVAGIMHSSCDLISDAIDILRKVFPGPLMAYPDSGYFKMPHWQFDDVISPVEFAQSAADWAKSGIQIIGGCCGLSPKHIEALAGLNSGLSSNH